MKLFNCKGLNKTLAACTCKCILYVCDFLVELHCECKWAIIECHMREWERERERELELHIHVLVFYYSLVAY